MLLLSGSNLFPPVVKIREAGFGPAAPVFARKGAPGLRCPFMWSGWGFGWFA
jgi:hypothetical protein